MQCVFNPRLKGCTYSFHAGFGGGCGVDLLEGRSRDAAHCFIAIGQGLQKHRDRHAGVGLKLPEGDQYLDAQQPIIAGKISHQCRYGQPRLGMQIAQHSHGCVVDAPVLIAQPGDQRGDDKIQIGALLRCYCARACW